MNEYEFILQFVLLRVLTHCGDGALQSTHLLFSFVLLICSSLERVSGSTSQFLLMVALIRMQCCAPRVWRCSDQGEVSRKRGRLVISHDSRQWGREHADGWV